jgi:uncharacterized membrane protein HdeD (DUF308 family)
MTDNQDNRDNIRQERRAVAQDRVSGKLGSIWWAFMLRGCLAALLGLIALFLPSSSVAMLLRIVGIFLIIDAATTLFSLRQAGERDVGMAQGALTGLAGLVLLIMPSASIRTVIVILGIWALVTGIGNLWSARKMDQADAERGSLMSVGVFATIVGLVLVFWPGIGAIAIGWVIAILAFIIAAFLIWVALRLKGVQQRIDGAGFEE